MIHILLIDANTSAIYRNILGFISLLGCWHLLGYIKPNHLPSMKLGEVRVAPAICQEKGEKEMQRGQWKGKPMQGKSHPILRAIGASLCTLALVLLAPTVSHAAQPDKHHHGHHHQHDDRFVSVPEPNVNVLLLIGLSVTSLVSYGVQRRKRGA